MSKIGNGLLFLACSAVSVASSQALAAAITPTFTQFGALPDATFGGSGIPNSSVAITRLTTELVDETIIVCDDDTGGGQVCEPQQIVVGSADITLGLSSHGRYENTLEGNDGAGTYFASAGSNIPPSSSREGSTWNFNYYVNIEDGNFAGFDFNLYYDFDPAAGNDQSTHGVINLNAGLALNQIDPAAVSLVEGSENLLFGFLSSPIPNVLTPPAVAFDPNAAGEYTFALTASNLLGEELGRSAIRVLVRGDDAQVPVPATLGLLGMGLLLLGRAGRRMRRS
jgi:hypothetical protein